MDKKSVRQVKIEASITEWLKEHNELDFSVQPDGCLTLFLDEGSSYDLSYLAKCIDMDLG